MSQETTQPGLTPPPDPQNDRPDDTPLPARVSRVITVLRVLINFGQTMLEGLHARSGRPLFVTATLPFGTPDPAAILARIACGLRRAAELEARLMGYAASGRDLPPARAAAAPPPTSKTQPPAENAPPCEPTARPAALPRQPRRRDPDGLPSVEQIAAQVRRHPIGVVIADICRDLGLLPGYCDREFLRELTSVIAEFGGTISRWVNVIDRRMKRALVLKRAWDEAEPPASTPHASGTGMPGTGPPPGMVPA